MVVTRFFLFFFSFSFMVLLISMDSVDGDESAHWLAGAFGCSVAGGGGCHRRDAGLLAAHPQGLLLLLFLIGGILPFSDTTFHFDSRKSAVVSECPFGVPNCQNGPSIGGGETNEDEIEKLEGGWENKDKLGGKMIIAWLLRQDLCGYDDHSIHGRNFHFDSFNFPILYRTL